jgi:hypothetical protein
MKRNRVEEALKILLVGSVHIYTNPGISTGRFVD